MKKVIRLTESDLARIVRIVIKESARAERIPRSWNEIKDIMKGDTMQSHEDGVLKLMKGGEFEEIYKNFSIRFW